MFQGLSGARLAAQFRGAVLPGAPWAKASFTRPAHCAVVGGLLALVTALDRLIGG